jgi:broad specificity phosphatase PhoE
MAGSLVDEADGSSLVDARPANKVDATIYLMRHGETALDLGANRSDGWLDFPLTDEGRQGIIPAQQCLKMVPLSAIYTSDLKRTRETAEIIKSGTLSDPKIVVDDDMKTWNLGTLAGLPKKYGRPEVQKLRLYPDQRAPGGESFNAFRGRFVPWFMEMTDKAAKTKKPVLLVLSGSALRLLGQLLLGDDQAVDLDESGLAALHKFGDVWSGEVFLGHEDANTGYES